MVLNCSGTPPSPGNQETLRKVDWDEFQLRLSAMNAHWFKSHRETCTCSDTIATGSDDSIVDVGSRGTGEGDGANTAAVAPTIDSPIAYTATAASDDAVDPAAAPEPEQPEPETDPEATELKAHTLELIQDFPRLMRDFDRFVECTRIMAARYYKR